MTYYGRMMPRVPTWAELRLDATELAELQHDCYRDVHDMLDNGIPELDRKLSILSNKNHQETKLAEIEKPKSIIIEKSKTVSMDDISKHVNKNKQKTWVTNIPKLVEAKKPITNGGTRNMTHDEKPRSPSEDDMFTIVDKKKTRKLSIVEPKQLDSSPADETDFLHDQTVAWRSLNYDVYEHLRPPLMPLSYYLKINRPDMIKNADRRVSYLKRKAERRRTLAAERTINALDQIRISSRASSNKRSSSSLRSSMVRTISRDSMPPNYQVKYNFSEQEMKRLTAKIYNRLPEVKKQRNQEVTKHLKVQNYKNKLDYGRKLVENRRRGIINYPLKSHYDESSIMSSLGDESLTNSLDRSVDGIRFESYY